jgi:hypothetical protein
MSDNQQEPEVRVQNQAGTNVGTPRIAASFAPPKAAVEEPPDPRMQISWHPPRAGATVELTSCVIHNVPPNPDNETDVISRILAGLLLEIMALRDRLEALEPVHARDEDL